MIKTFSLITFVIVSFFAGALRAQDTTQKSKPIRIGIGVSTQYNIGHGYDMHGGFELPIDFPHYRIEPAAYFGNSFKSTSTDKTSTFEYSEWTPSLGFFYQSGIEKSVNYYIGLRLGMVITTEKSVDNGVPKEETSYKVVVSPTAGFEWMISRHFSLGLEEQNNFSLAESVADYEVSVGIALMFRWHF